MITGRLEKGMQESAQAALSYIRSREKVLGLEEEFHAKYDVHVHFPNFNPKDGPSAGITMATSIASSFLKIPVRKNIAMTGEITLRGRVRPIGGLKEKMLAAHRAGLDTILVPRENRKDLREIPRRVLNADPCGARRTHGRSARRSPSCSSDPDALFGGGRTKPLEYRQGKLIEPEQPGDSDPKPTVEGPGAHQ